MAWSWSGDNRVVDFFMWDLKRSRSGRSVSRLLRDSRIDADAHDVFFGATRNIVLIIIHESFYSNEPVLQAQHPDDLFRVMQLCRTQFYPQEPAASMLQAY